MSKDYSHIVKNKVLPGGKMVSDYMIMTGKGLSEVEMAYIDEVGILPVAPKEDWVIPEGY